jgi:hypothetical protein
MTAQEEFWNWFVRHEAELYDLDPNWESERERIFDELGSELQKVDSDLTFELGPNQPRREFVISASGIKRAFPSVVSVAEAAPRLDRWQVTAFRPRRTIPSIVEFRGKRVDPRDVQVSLLDNGKIAGVYLFIPGFREGDLDWKQVGYLLLDDLLGEYDVEFRLGLIKMGGPDQTQTETERFPLAELPKQFDQLVSRLERAGRPS